MDSGLVGFQLCKYTNGGDCEKSSILTDIYTFCFLCNFRGCFPVVLVPIVGKRSVSVKKYYMRKLWAAYLYLRNRNIRTMEKELCDMLYLQLFVRLEPHGPVRGATLPRRRGRRLLGAC